MRLALCVLLLNAAAQPAAPPTGSICLGPDLREFIAIDAGHPDQAYLVIDDSERLFLPRFKGDLARLAVSGLDLHKVHRARLFFEDGRPMESWSFRFDKLSASMVDIWLDRGAARMEPNRAGRCVWPRQ